MGQVGPPLERGDARGPWARARGPRGRDQREVDTPRGASFAWRNTNTEGCTPRASIQHVDKVLFGGGCFVPRGGYGDGSGADFGWHDDDDADYDCGEDADYDNFAYRSW